MSKNAFRQVRFDADSDAARNVQAALQAADMAWQVGLKPIFIEDADAIGGIREIEGRKAVTRLDTGNVFDVVGSGFTPVQNTDSVINRWIQPLLDSGEARLVSAGHIGHGRRIYLQAALRDGSVDVTPGDTVEAYVNFANGHDGSLSAGAGYSSIRVVCQNTMMMMARSLAFRARHTAGVRDALEAARVEFAAQRDALKGQADTFKAFTVRKLSDKNLVSYVREVLSEGAGADPEITVKGVEAIVRAAHEAPGATPGTLWGGLNAVTYWASHERGRSDDSRVNSLMFGDGGQLIERAVQVAVAYADHLPSNVVEASYHARQNTFTAAAEFSALLGRPARIAAETDAE